MEKFGDISLVSNEKSASVNETINKIVEQFAYAPHIRNNNNLAFFSAQDELEDPDEYERVDNYKREVIVPSAFLQKSVFAKKIRQNEYKEEDTELEETIESQLSGEGSSFDLNTMMNQGRLMHLKLDMDKFPDQALTIEDFVIVMKEVIQGNIEFDDLTLISQLMDNFYRIDVHNTGKVTFDMVSSYLIEQEIMAEMNKERTLLYRPSSTIDESRHDNYIDKLFYFKSFDKLGVMEQNMRALKIYNTETMRHERTYLVSTGIALGAEYIQEFHVIVLTSSDKSMLVFQAGTDKLLRKIMTPDAQHSLVWSHKTQILFTGGMEGKIYGWVMEKILNPDKKGEEMNYETVLAKGMPWKDGETVIFNLVELTGMNQIATACSDNLIRVWDIKWENNLSPRKRLKGHIKAVRFLAYSHKFNLLISCGFEFDALVWNPYVSEPICWLKGHEAPLTGIECPEVNPTIISADSKGIIKIWNIRDYSLIQTFYVPNVLKLKSIKSIPKHRRLVTASRKLQIFDYEKSFIPELSDDSPIFCARYSALQLQIFIAGQSSIKVWNSISGRPIRIITDIFNSEITSIILDETDRKIIVGDHEGKIVMVDSLSGVILKEFCSHSGEVTAMFYVSDDNLLITGSWDKKIMIHNDSLKGGNKEKNKGVVRSISNAHSDDILCLSYSRYLDLIASGSRDCHVRVWDYETCKLEGTLIGHNSDIIVTMFLDPYPLLFVSDTSGTLSIWAIQSPGLARIQCLVKWRNMHTLEKTATITAATYYCAPGSCKLVLGDEKGTLRILELEGLISDTNIVPLEIKKIELKSRNPTRLAEVNMRSTDQSVSKTINRKNSGSSVESEEGHISNNLEFLSKPIKDDYLVKQTSTWKGHTDAIKYLAVVKETQETCIFSAGLDSMAKLWNLNKELLGTLMQGNKFKNKWNFPLRPNIYSEKQDKANQIVSKMAKLPKSNERFGSPKQGDKRTGFNRLNTRMVEENPPMLTDKEMLKNLKEVEKLLPRDSLYEVLKEGKTFRAKKPKKSNN
jgi:WD40 repeat protein